MQEKNFKMLPLKVGQDKEEMGWKQVNARKKLTILRLKVGQGKEEMGWKQVMAIKRFKILRKWKRKISKKKLGWIFTLEVESFEMF